jgi:hypothetical protein
MEKFMSRLASGDEAVLLKAREAIASAQTVEQLRQAQAVVLPLDYAMSLAGTAHVIGVSPGWACQLRKRFMRGQVVGTPYVPEFNPIEQVWDELREKFFHNRVFKRIDALQDHLVFNCNNIRI